MILKMFQYGSSYKRIKSPNIIVYQGFIETYVLLRQGSNLDSSDPESDVLPITPRSNFGIAKLRHL